jgi:O-antigen ligase
LGVIILVGSPRWSILVFVLAGVVGFAKFDTINRLLLAGDNSYSLMTRLEAWRIVFEIVKVNPFLGLGPSNYYFYTPLFPILGYSVQFNSHNNYVDIIAQTGILGLLCFLWLAWEIGLLGWKLRERVPQGSFSRAYVYGALGGLAGSLAAAMLGDWLIPFVYNIG